jgi:hypothetical protein
MDSIAERVPGIEEINIYNDLDSQVAVKNWLGKSIEDAVIMLAKNPLKYQEDLRHMGPVAFRYYLLAVVRFVKSGNSDGDEDFFHSILGVMRERMDACFGYGESELSSVVSMLNHVKNNLGKFYGEDSFLMPEDRKVIDTIIEQFRTKPT